jgi:hypothetical protein
LPINATPAYLRHRAWAERAHRARRRALWRFRSLVLLACGLLYLGIGPDVVQLARARKDAAAMEMRADLHRLSTDVERISATARLSSASETVSPIAFTSAAALAANGDPDDVDAWLSGEPVETFSRSRYAER